MSDSADIVVVGAGAAGLMAAIWAKRTSPHSSVVVLDGAQKLGAKILVSGGGRCNVTHDFVDAGAYAGSSRNAVKKILDRFDADQTVTFFSELGVRLKREETGKLFPVTDNSRTILDALLHAAKSVGIVIHNPWRVESIQDNTDSFRVVNNNNGALRARSIVLATGGRSLPKSGSDGYGYTLAKSLGHLTTKRIFPALVPLTLPRDHFICYLSGITLPATIELRSSTGKRHIAFTDSTLCTHFGLSGPSILDFSRHYLSAKLDDPNVQAVLNWLPAFNSETFEHELQGLGNRTVLRLLNTHFPERLADALLKEAGVEPTLTGNHLTREGRRKLATTVTQYPLPVTGDRGYNYAEVTAGGIPLSDLYLNTMQSRICPGLYFCGEICDVDGRIGGYNFQWAWSSGYVAGLSVGQGN